MLQHASQTIQERMLNLATIDAGFASRRLFVGSDILDLVEARTIAPEARLLPPIWLQILGAEKKPLNGLLMSATVRKIGTAPQAPADKQVVPGGPAYHPCH